VTWNVGGVSGTVPVDAGTLYRAVGEMRLFGENGGYGLVSVSGFGRLEIVPELDSLINGASM
nr:hypothetical protein [Tanacetum cinerariifolium]